MSAASYWDQRFTEGIDHHVRQNDWISQDFLAALARQTGLVREPIKRALAGDLIEFGCGSGDLLAAIVALYEPASAVGTDLSEEAVALARRRWPHIPFHVADLRAAQSLDLHPSLAISSNVIEHFTQPVKAIEHMLGIAPQVLVLAPWEQEQLDRFEDEGGAGHVSVISQATFDPFTVQARFRFKTRGWSCASSVWQVAALLER